MKNIIYKGIKFSVGKSSNKKYDYCILCKDKTLNNVILYVKLLDYKLEVTLIISGQIPKITLHDKTDDWQEKMFEVLDENYYFV